MRERGWLPDDRRKRVAKLATDVTWEALEELFSDARGVMKWLSDCARIVASNWNQKDAETAEEARKRGKLMPMVRSRDVLCTPHTDPIKKPSAIDADRTLNLDPKRHIGQPVKWASPLGMVVMQPYRQKERAEVRTILQRVVLNYDSERLPVMGRKQATAFPPNFVHCIDSSHMMMTATACLAKGMVFAGVHDSFWTHPCDVDAMNVVIRDEFVKLHSQPLLEKLKAYLEKEHPHLDFPPVPAQGKLDLEEVKRATFFFS